MSIRAQRGKRQKPGRKATAKEADAATAQALALWKVIRTINLPAATKYIREHAPSPEAIAMLPVVVFDEVTRTLHHQQQQRVATLRHAKNYAAKSRARELADEFRKTKPDARIGEGVFYIAVGLKQEGFPVYTDATIHGWIKDIFPKHLRSRGRPPKD